MWVAMPICLLLLTQIVRWARSLALASAGRRRLARMAMMAMTTRSSIKVKPRSERRVLTDSSNHNPRTGARAECPCALRSTSKRDAVNDNGDDSADDRADDGNPGVTPIAVALVRNGKDRVH